MKDAWQRLNELLERFIKEWDVRPDLSVTAHACDRSVEFQIGEARVDHHGPLDVRDKFIWHSAGRRNVSTMRELAQALLDACDFVDASNPEWAALPDFPRTCQKPGG